MLLNKMSNRMGRLFKSSTGKIILSIIIGLGLASLFRRTCDDSNCVIYRALNYEDDVKDKTFRHDDKCYQYKIQPISCSKSNDKNTYMF